MMAISNARHRANEKYNAKAYDEIKVRVTKGRKEEIQAEAERRGQSVNGFINGLINAALSPGVPSAGAPSSPAFEDRSGVVMVSAGAFPDENSSSRAISLTAPPKISTAAGVHL